MLRILVLVLTTVLFVGCTTATNQNQNNASSPTTTPTATGTPTATASVAAASPSPSAPTTANVKNDGIKWKDEASGTPVTTIKVGGKVTWTVSAGAPHSLRRDAGTAENGCNDLDASFDTPGNISPGTPVTRTFDKVGVYGYHCGVHLGTPNCKTPPGTGAMPGVIRVVP